MNSNIDKEHYQWLERMLQNSSNIHCRSKIYRILKQYLLPLGYWKAKPRGKPPRDRYDMQRRMSKSTNFDDFS